MGTKSFSNFTSDFMPRQSKQRSRTIYLHVGRRLTDLTQSQLHLDSLCISEGVLGEKYKHFENQPGYETIP